MQVLNKKRKTVLQGEGTCLSAPICCGLNLIIQRQRLPSFVRGNQVLLPQSGSSILTEHEDGCNGQWAMGASDAGSTCVPERLPFTLLESRGGAHRPNNLKSTNEAKLVCESPKHTQVLHM